MTEAPLKLPAVVIPDDADFLSGGREVLGDGRPKYRRGIPHFVHERDNLVSREVIHAQHREPAPRQGLNVEWSDQFDKYSPGTLLSASENVSHAFHFPFSRISATWAIRRVMSASEWPTSWWNGTMPQVVGFTATSAFAWARSTIALRCTVASNKRRVEFLKITDCPSRGHLKNSGPWPQLHRSARTLPTVAPPKEGRV